MAEDGLSPFYFVFFFTFFFFFFGPFELRREFFSRQLKSLAPLFAVWPPDGGMAAPFFS